MKIGVISSGNDTLTLRNILTKYNHEYIICHDQTFFPFWEKNLDIILERIHTHLLFLQSQKVDHVIVDPIYELALSSWEKNILPLFQTYLEDEVLPYSLVGSMGLLTEKWDAIDAQPIFAQAVAAYQPTLTQKNIKSFHFPFNYRIKTPKSWQKWIQELWVHNPYLIRTLKNDLRYFKDANIDTFIPLHYMYFAMGRTIKSFFNPKKTRFFDLSFIEKSFKKLTSENISPAYSVQIRTNQSQNFLLENKKLLRLLERGKSVSINRKILS